MKFEVIHPLNGESIFAPNQLTATELANELGQTFYIERESDNYPYADIKWVWKIIGGMLVRSTLEDLEENGCTCGQCLGERPPS